MAQLTAEDRKLVARMKSIRELLAFFDARLYGHDPGVTFAVKSGMRCDQHGKFVDCWVNCESSGPQWAWLEPLLLELREHRRRGLRKLTITDKETILGLARKGKGIVGIARELGIHGHIVNGFLSTAWRRGLLPPAPKAIPPRPMLPPTQEEQLLALAKSWRKKEAIAKAEGKA